MPQNKFQKMVFAFITVVITVHAYVFYSLYVVNGQTLMSLTGAGSVLGAIKQLGGVYIARRLSSHLDGRCGRVYSGLLARSRHGEPLLL